MLYEVITADAPVSATAGSLSRSSTTGSTATAAGVFSRISVCTGDSTEVSSEISFFVFLLEVPLRPLPLPAPARAEDFRAGFFSAGGVV